MSMTLLASALAGNVALAQGMSIDAWVSDQGAIADKVALFRSYADGDHRASLTAEMRTLLRISSDATLDQFNDNYMDVIIQTMVDRLNVSRIEADTEAGTEWVDGVLDANRFDGIQQDVHQAAVRDGHTYVMVSYDEEAGRVVLTPEPAYDGSYGMLSIHDTTGSAVPDVAIKVWQTTTTSLADTVRLNVYYPDRVEKYASDGSGGLRRYTVEGEPWPAPWVDRAGDPLGVPVVKFANRPETYTDQGRSEIEDAIPLQDALNRTLYSMVMAAELSAFQIRYLFGMKPPSAVTPGMWIYSDVPQNAGDHPYQIGVLPVGDLSQYINMARWLTSEMGKITRTPSPEFMGTDDASGEALKQREVGLLGKVRRFQVKGGNAWEDVLRMAYRVQQTFGQAQPPACERFMCRWQDAELRNDTAVIDNALKVADRVGQREFLRMIAPVYGWDEDHIDRIMAERAQETVQTLSLLPGANRDYSGMAF